jgi:outer membrane receptor protein involved in Fe transport
VFAEATYTVWDKLDLTAGLRLFRGTQDFDLKFSGLFGNLINSTPSKPQSSIRRPAASSETSKGGNPRFAAAYRLDEDHTVYASAGKASATAVTISRCRSTSAAECAVDLRAGQPVELRSRFQNTLFDRRVTFNASAYLIKWKDVQVFNKLPCTYYFTQNAGKIRSEGVELESFFNLPPGLGGGERDVQPRIRCRRW